MIVLFTDFGTRDAYVAQLKGVILGIHPTAQLLDLTHEVRVFDVREAAYLLDAAVRYFPAGTICLGVVDPGVGTARRPLLLCTQEGKTYVGPDNGLFTRVLAREGLQAVYTLTQTAYFLPQVSTTFHGRDIFAPVAAHLARGVAPTAFGPAIDDMVCLPAPAPQRAAHELLGEVLHIDHFGNVITNIPAAWFPGLAPGHRVACTLEACTHILPYVTTYGGVPQDQLVCLLNSSAEFEIALPCASAAQRLGVQVGTAVRLRQLGPPAGA
ncbi:MAG: S-adenosyl-l-methionine hydroxide adenosyltransferase family protein [Candidatus Tectimicrobiota bacterium]